MIDGITLNKLTKFSLDELLTEIETRSRFCVILCDNPSNTNDTYYTILKGSTLEKGGAIKELQLMFEFDRNQILREEFEDDDDIEEFLK